MWNLFRQEFPKQEASVKDEYKNAEGFIATYYPDFLLKRR